MSVCLKCTVMTKKQRLLLTYNCSEETIYKFKIIKIPIKTKIFILVTDFNFTIYQPWDQIILTRFETVD